MPWLITLDLILLLAASAPAPPLAFSSAGPPPLGAAKSPDWETLFDRTNGWTGGDCAGSIPLGDGRCLWMFADSWVGPVREGRHAEGSKLVNNAIAVHAIRADGSPPASVTFAWGPPDAEGKPTAWVRPAPPRGRDDEKPDQTWYWSIGGGVVVAPGGGRERLHVFLARMRQRGANDATWDFEDAGCVVATVDEFSGPPDRWTVRQSLLTSIPRGAGPAVRRIRWGVAAMLEDAREISRQDDHAHKALTRPTAEAGHVLIYGVDITDGLNKKLVLARSPAKSVERFETWRFRTRRGWSSRPDDAAPLAGNVMDELSIHCIGVGGQRRYVLIYSKPIFDDRILARTAPQPEGPWSEPTVVFRCPEPSQDDRLMVYAAKGHPELSAPGELLISYCVNSRDFEHMAANAWIYRPRFIRAPLEMLASHANP